jgi:D-psicose/D-tagatose/L-ribulose 3-epimerase
MSETVIGASTWIWVSPLDDERLAELVPRLAGWGFDLVELPVESPGDWDPSFARSLLSRHGLRAGVCAVMAPGRDLCDVDAATVVATQDYLRGCVDAAAAVGAGVVAGPMYAATGRVWPIPASERPALVHRLAAALRPVAAHAESCEVRLAIEPLNRYETSVLNTVAQALELVDAVDSPACGLLLDTYHMNIEERDLAEAIRVAGPRLYHLHACANDRGAPGADHIDWPAIAGALAAIGYAGAVSIESFTGENQAIARAASIWRPLAASQDAIATDGLRFLRARLGARP